MTTYQKVNDNKKNNRALGQAWDILGSRHMAHLLKIVLLGASVFMALTLVLDTCSSPSARDGSTSPCRRRHVGVLMHSRVGKDRSHLRNASRVFVFGILPSHYHDITLRVGPHQDFMALVSQDKRFEFVDVFTASKATVSCTPCRMDRHDTCA